MTAGFRVREQKFICGKDYATADTMQVDFFEITEQQHKASTRKKKELASSIAKEAYNLRKSGRYLELLVQRNFHKSDYGVESGMEVIRQIFPKLNMTPGILLAPGWSENALVSAGLQAKTSHINGVFNCVCIVDIDSSTAGATKYDDVKRQKEKQAVTSANCYAVWLYAKVGDVIYAGSAMAAAATVATDANNGDIPNVSPDNKPISISAACLKDGTEVLLDQEQANVVNSFGVATWLNMNGFRLWGNNTACYPGNTDPKDRWFSVRRFFCWDDNTFIQTYFQKVSDPLNKRLIEALVDSENVRGNSFVSRGICARYELQYIESENPTTDLLNGTVKFHKYMSPFNPAEDIEEIVEFDPNAISTALAG